MDVPYLFPPVYSAPPAHQDPDFLRAAAWLSRDKDGEPLAVVVGAPFSALSISRARCDLLPGALRESLWSFSTYLPSRGLDLAGSNVRDVGDIDVEGATIQESLDRVQSVVTALRTSPVAIVGGDNSITAPAMMGATGPGGGLITIDAHHDVRNYERDGLSNGSPVRVLLDSGVRGSRIWQIGIRDLANSKAHSDYVEKQGIHVVSAPEVRASGIASFAEKALASLAATDGIYVDVDLDVVERALAPGAPGAQPGGLLPEHVVDAAFICGAHPAVVALDIVEVDPERDVAEATVRLASLVLLSFLAGVASR